VLGAGTFLPQAVGGVGGRSSKPTQGGSNEALAAGPGLRGPVKTPIGPKLANPSCTENSVIPADLRPIGHPERILSPPTHRSEDDAVAGFRRAIPLSIRPPRHSMGDGPPCRRC
jgi:hypothetical protein